MDCDEKAKEGTYFEVVRFLSDNGLEPGSYPVVQTASISGRHIYLRLEGSLPGHCRTLSEKFGAGEIRYGPGAMVVAPQSCVNTESYQVIKGDLSRLPQINSTEVLKLINSSGISCLQGKATPTMSRLALRLLRSKDEDGYRCRSTATQVLLTCLVNTGHDFNSVLSLFMANPACGKFKEMHQVNPTIAIKWLHLSFSKAKDWSSKKDSEDRMLAHSLKAWAMQKEWTGRTGRTDRAVYLALTDIAISAGSLTIGASIRDLAIRSAISKNTACKAIGRLRTSQYLQLVKPSKRDLANIYCLNVVDGIGTLPHNKREIICTTFHQHDAFRHGGLNKSGASICEFLKSGPATIDEIVSHTGLSKRTVKNYLMNKFHPIDSLTNEVISIVRCERERWILNDVDFDRIAELLNLAGKTERERRKFEVERLIYLKVLDHYSQSHK